MGRRGPHALILALLAGCVPPREPARHLGGEAQFLAAYVRARTSTCADGTFELGMAPRPNTVIETLPATYESQWELRACGQALAFTLDCSVRGETWSCGAHEWPMPAGADVRLAREIEAVAGRAPACPPERSCVAAKQCREEGRVVRRLPRDRDAKSDVARYEVGRCGLVSSVNVRCTAEAPFQCVTTASAPVDTTRPW